ncbi:MAG: class I SAM-dependent methyltransferase [Clostridiales bacterium]|nr:class I SAM-dependent methyltransferase [Clostridiales bacterium]
MNRSPSPVSKPPVIPYEFGVPLESVLARRERLANNFDMDFGQERVFPELVEALLAEVPEGVDVLEVGAATGLMTRPLLRRARQLTALEPSEGMLRRLLASDVAAAPNLTTRQGMVEDLAADDVFDVAVVTFTPRRGLGLARLLFRLTCRVRDRVVMLLDDDGALDWAYLGRTAAMRGLDVNLRLVSGAPRQDGHAERPRAVILVAEVARFCELSAKAGDTALFDVDEWAGDAREIAVPYPMPRGAATRLVRYMLAGGDRALKVVTEPEGAERLYGNVRTAVHRLARDLLTVRRDGSTIHIVRLPGGHEGAQ